MPFVEWKDTYTIGVEEIDEDHRRLVDMINELHAGIARNCSGGVREVVDELETMLYVLDDLVDYATDHFALEEDSMLEHAYPGYASMKRAHREFLSMAQQLRDAFDSGRPISSQRTLESLKAWFDNHVLGLDMRFGEFVKSKGIKLRRKTARA